MEKRGDIRPGVTPVLKPDQRKQADETRRLDQEDLVKQAADKVAKPKQD